MNNIRNAITTAGDILKKVNDSLKSAEPLAIEPLEAARARASNVVDEMTRRRDQLANHETLLIELRRAEQTTKAALERALTDERQTTITGDTEPDDEQILSCAGTVLVARSRFLRALYRREAADARTASIASVGAGDKLRSAWSAALHSAGALSYGLIHNRVDEGPKSANSVRDLPDLGLHIAAADLEIAAQSKLDGKITSERRERHARQMADLRQLFAAKLRHAMSRLTAQKSREEQGAFLKRLEAATVRAEIGGAP